MKRFAHFIGTSLLLVNSAIASNLPGQTLQVYTHFREIIGKPSWLLIIRDVNTEQVFPYLFDIRNNDNFWVAFTEGHSYRVTVSNLKFGTDSVINNFCGLENGILSGKSMYITLSGTLSSDRATSKCFVQTYNGMPFTVVNDNK
ncbi:MAG TPA: hypothetical protein VJL60_00110 [Gammaproteobacteria bacterium]|nr:hypothetical protein [Gammaproteobacteria bacterium]